MLQEEGDSEVVAMVEDGQVDGPVESDGEGCNSRPIMLMPIV